MARVFAIAARSSTVILGLVAVGCTPQLPEPALDSVEPRWGYNGEDTEITLVGRNLYPEVSAGGPSSLSLDHQFRAWLVGDERLPLEGVELDSYSQLTAHVPAGIDTGVYDIKIESPAGQTAVLPAAFTVTDTRADHLSLSLTAPNHTVNTPALVQVTLYDPTGKQVASPEDIEVRLTTEDGDPSSLSFLDDITLDNQEALDDGVGVSGSLGPSGDGWFAITSSEVADVLVTVRAADDSSVVAETSDTVFFTSGTAASVEISLPLMVAVDAGEEFPINLTLLDAAGNPTEAVSASLLLYETCPGGSLNKGYSFIDDLQGELVAVTGATNGFCEKNSLAVVGVADGVEITGQSDSFQVLPGDGASLAVLASPDEIEAGLAGLTVWIEVRDEWGNFVDDHPGGTPWLDDSAGGLDPDLGVGQQDCDPFSAVLSRTRCTVSLWRAGEGITLTAHDDVGLIGISNDVTVLPGDLASLDLAILGSTVAAGDELAVLLTGVDDFDNVVDTDFEIAGALSFSDLAGPASCRVDRAVTPPSGVIYRCSLTVATVSDVLTATFVTPDASLVAVSGTFDVTNGALADCEIDLGGVSSVTAGQALATNLTGRDAYGNPYIDGSSRTVDLSDDSGSLAVRGGSTAVVLDSAGQAEVDLVFTTARVNNRVTAASGSTRLGVSAAFDVVAGALAGFSVSPERTWAWLDEPLNVAVTAVDSWGNPVLSYASPVTLRSPTGLGDDVSVSSFSDGVADTSFEFHTAGLAETLEVLRAGVVSGTSDAIDALDDTCASGPVAALTVAGDSPTTLCLSGGTTPVSTASAASSTTGSAALVAWHWDTGDDIWFRDTSSSQSLSWDEEGGWRVSVVVVDANACGSEADTEVYVAEADGRPAGPVDVSLADSALTAGTDTTLIEVEATDCSGDPSTGDLYAWVDLGLLDDGVTSALSSVGDGLYISLVGGVGDMTWSVIDEYYDGTGTIRVGALSGAAYGQASATISGDSARPQVLDMDPAGTTTDPFSTVVLTFSEPMLSRSIATSVFSLTDAAGNAKTISAATPNPTYRKVTLDLDSEAGRGTWTLTASSDLRDESGNKLDGTYTGTASSFSLTFGDVTPTAIDVTGCDVDTDTFRPDGDEGTGEEADYVELDLTASGLPTWWRLDIVDADGYPRYTSRLTPVTSTHDAQEWSGRDQDGRIVENGTYTLSISAEDAYWNTGTSCQVEVVVDNLVREIP